MKDTKKILRTAIYNALSALTYNSISVPVVDEKLESNQTADVFIILSTQQETPEENNDSIFITRSGIDIEIYNKTGTETSKDVVDDVYELMMEILMPTTQTIGLTIPAGFQFLNGQRESCVTQSFATSGTETIVVSRVKLVFTIVQQ